MGRSIERVIAIYEAGWSGFWLARWLTRHKVEVYVIQPSSVPVDRRMRRAKSDGIDAELLLRTLLAWLRGEPRVCSMVPVPDEADEDARRCIRERTELISERVGLTNRIGAVLATAVAFTVQSWAQQFLPATHTALILALEPVFAWITSFLFLGERLNIRASLGALLILSGIVLTELLPGRIQPTAHEG